ncbi:MAG: AraC family transcriptional regulator [Balneolaceae bacterium]
MQKVIKHMVCPRCVESVESAARELSLPVESVQIGNIRFTRRLREEELSLFSEELENRGFELAQNRVSEIASQVHSKLFEYLDHLEKERNPLKVSEFLSEKLPYNYSYMSDLFSKEHGDTIEQFLIKLKIERVKELLSYDRFTLSEIAWKLKYSSVQYLSNQFKSVTGKTVTEYRKQEKPGRISLDQL